jgi:hypothetical protein
MEGERLNEHRLLNPGAPNSSPEGTSRDLSAMTMAVTGANGFVGARVTELLGSLDSPPQLRPLSRRHARGQNHTVVDLADPASVATGLKGCDAVMSARRRSMSPLPTGIWTKHAALGRADPTISRSSWRSRTVCSEWSASGNWTW